MLDALLIPTAILYLLVVGVLFVYGINFMYLAGKTLRNRGQVEPPPMPERSQWPRVTVQLPLYNELYVARRVIRAAARLDYPADLLQIQVLDDSTDETVDIVREEVAQLRRAGVSIVHLHRRRRTGYKAGALQAGLKQATGEFLALFDADFVPPPDFLLKTLPYFVDAKVAFVQTRWGHLNHRSSLFTSLQSLAIDAHFMVEQYARSLGGYLFNFNGTAGVWRRQAVVDAGGWTADTLTEDLDISYRAMLRGWSGRYLRDLEVPAELPVSFSAFRRQQHRWARGSLECARKLLPDVWQSTRPTLHKIQATLHVTGYLVHILLFSLAILYPIVLTVAERYENLIALFGISYVFNLTALAPTFFFVTGQRELRRSWPRLLPRILMIMILGTGLMVNSLRAALQIFLQREARFERTAKFGLERMRQEWTGKRYQLKLDAIVLLELALAVYNFATVHLAWQSANWAIAFYSALFGLGLLYVAVLSIWQALAIARRQRRYAATPGVPELEGAQLRPWPAPLDLKTTAVADKSPGATA